MRTKIILFLIVVYLFLYWRGITNIAQARGWDCKYQIVYAICNPKNNKATLPGIWDILKAGAKF